MDFGAAILHFLVIAGVLRLAQDKPAQFYSVWNKNFIRGLMCKMYKTKFNFKKPLYNIPLDEVLSACYNSHKALIR